MCGTFDVKNYGDLLFPLVLRHALGKRIQRVEVECFSYHPKVPPNWPYPVLPVNRLPDVIHSFDAVVIGGGHLIRFDRNVAPGYFPPSPEMHHPTSYWLFPALLAIEAKVPLIWSAVGASPELPAWGCEILREVLRASTYVSVRDAASQSVLQKLTGDREVLIVPDTVFGIRDLHPEYHNNGSHRDVGDLYVVIQATPNLKPHADSLQRLLLWLRSQKYEVVLLPISPALGDDPEILREIVGREAIARLWADPMEVVAIIANAAAVVGVSLHLSITALAFGVPVLRPFGNALSKYQAIHHLPGVIPLEEYAERSERLHHAILHRGRRSEETEAFCAALARHWDRIAAILSARSRTSSSGLASLFHRLPFLLENGSDSGLKS